MRVDIIINGQAGYADRVEIETHVRRVLFRCELHFHSPPTIEAMRETIERVCELGSESLIISGGDGTLNSSLTPIIRRYKENLFVPPICLVPVGTANDLASHMGIPKKIEKAARAVLEGRVKTVDVIEITCGDEVSHMITNGGLGIPAETAKNANAFRSWVKKRARESAPFSRNGLIFKLGEKLIARAGKKIYELLLIRDVVRWDTRSWDVTLEIPGREPFRTSAPFILINNQPCVGGSFVTAPLTTNSDGLFNVLLIEPTEIAPQMKAIMDIRFGKTPDEKTCPSFETSSLKLTATHEERSLTFFGDGEILHRDVREISVKCLHPGIPLVTME